MLHSDVFSAMSAKLSNQGHTMVNPSACLSKYFTCSSVIRSAEEFNWTCCNVAGGADMEAASIAPDEDNGVPAGSTSIEQSRLCSVRESCVRPCAPVASQMLNDTHNAIDMFLRTSFGCNRCTSSGIPTSRHTYGYPYLVARSPSAESYLGTKAGKRTLL